MNTVGDIARSTASQIEIYPLPPPKLANIQKALALYQERLVTSPSLSPIIGPTGESLTPVASTSEEPIGTDQKHVLILLLYSFLSFQPSVTEHLRKKVLPYHQQ